MSMIFKCRLFKDFTLQEINNFFRKYQTLTRTYQKDDILFHKGDNCTTVGIVVSGSIDVQEIATDGSCYLLSKLIAGHLFGEVLLYSKQHSYPATFVASSEVEVLYIDKHELIRALGAHKKLLVNFLQLMANRALDLNNRLKVLTKPSLRSKISSYILSVSNNEDKVAIGMTKEKLAEYLSVQRPSLSRELISMKDDGLIHCDRKFFYIINRDELEKL